MYYIEKNNKILFADKDKQRLINTLIMQPELTEKDIQELPEGYVIENFEFMTVEEQKQRQQAKERERIAMISLTAADVERAIYKAKGMDFEDIITLVEQSNSVDEQNVTNSSALQPFNLSTPIDIKALKIELKANNFYRGNPYVDIVGNLLGYTSEDLDYLFENKVLPEKIVEVEND